MGASVHTRGELSPASDLMPPTRREVLGLAAIALVVNAPATAIAGNSSGQLTWGLHISLTPTWFDPAETSGNITPFLILYALHDALVKPMPGQPLAPCLAESWSASEDELTYDFVLRKGIEFHNGDPVTADDVKFSFQRYRGAAHALIQDHVATVETQNSRHVRFKLKEPWPDFLTVCCAVTGAGWVVPKAYVERVGEEGFKKAPIGAGPYKFVSFTPGAGVILEAFDRYWRKTPKVQHLAFKVIPDESTRLVALKRGEIDIAYLIRGELAKAVQNAPGLTLKPVLQGVQWVEFPDQWDANSPWHDQRVRLAANLAIDGVAINDALTLGYSHVTGSIIPDDFEFYWGPPAPLHDPVKARRLLADAGYSQGFDAREFSCDSAYANVAEAVLNNLYEVGIHAKLRPLERGAFLRAWEEKKLRNIVLGQSGVQGNAATRLELFMIKGGAYAHGSYPDMDALFQQQSMALDRTKREAILHTIQQLAHERTMFAPVYQPAFISAVGPRVGESSFGRIPEFPYTAPYEDMTLRDG